jgi:hypothetical protein
MSSQVSRLRRPAVLASLAAAIAAGPLFAAERVSSGEWEFVMTTDGQSHSAKHCVTADEARGFNGDAASGRKYAEEKGKGSCSIKAYDVSGNTITYSMICGDRQIDSVTEYAEVSSKGLLTTTHAGQSVTTNVAARRVGDCK